MVDPVRLKVCGQDHRFHVPESHGSKRCERWPDIGAFIPGTAAAIENDLSIFRLVCSSFFEFLDPLRPRARPSIHGPGDMY